MLIVILKSLVIGALAGFAVSAGAARMFHAPETQAMGAFRTLGELNACKGDAVAHFSFGAGFLLNAAGNMVGAGALRGRVTLTGPCGTIVTSTASAASRSAAAWGG